MALTFLFLKHFMLGGEAVLVKFGMDFNILKVRRKG